MPSDSSLDQLEGELRLILLAIALVFAASVVVCWALIKRWTSGRQSTALAEWARAHGFALHWQGRAHVPVSLMSSREPLQPVVALADSKTRLIQLESPPASASNALRWNALSRQIESAWPPTALRPVNAERSLADLFGLEPHPVLGAGERFLVCGVDKPAARVLARSSIRGLLPADVGLMLHGNELLLDFSSRPFDEIEFGRMIAVVDQLVGRLPALVAS